MEHTHNDLFELFCEEVQDMVSSENQIVKALPNLITKASNEELKKALTTHLDETRKQVKRLDQICNFLKVKRDQSICNGMKGILQEVEEMTESKKGSSALDAAIIAAAQKVEHYEIATYGTLVSYAKQLELDDEQVIDLLKETLNEEGAADKKLTKIAEGSLFRNGINKLAAAGHETRGRF